MKTKINNYTYYQKCVFGVLIEALHDKFESLDLLSNRAHIQDDVIHKLINVGWKQLSVYISIFDLGDQ